MAGVSGRPALPRRVGLLVGGGAVLEVVIAVFLFVMAALTVAATGRALVAGGVVAGLAALALLALGRSVRSGAGGSGAAAWACRLLPVLAAAVVVVPASVGWISWLGVPLVVFAAAPAAVMGVVVPTLVRDASRTS